MGFELSLVQSDERHHGIFVCPICQSLVDQDCLVTTACSHCFCKSCLPMWLQKASTCPTCNQNLLYSHNTNGGNGSTTNSNHSNSHQSMMIGHHTVMVQPLERSQPVAHRLLKSLLVECPLQSTGVTCHWKGDYGDLEAHLLSSTAHSPSSGSVHMKSNMNSSTSTSTSTSSSQSDIQMTTEQHAEQQMALAASLKEEANGKFATQHYPEARALYTKAIDVLIPVSDKASSLSEDPTRLVKLLATLYSNRAAVSLQLQAYSDCLDDCDTVVRRELDPNNVKVYVRAARANLQLGQLMQARKVLQNGMDQDRHSKNSTLLKELETMDSLLVLEARGTDELAGQQYAAAKATFGSLLKQAPSAVPFLLGAAHADLGLGLTDSALRLTKRVLMKHAQNPRGCWIRGQALFLMGDKDANIGMQLLQEALRLDPDSKLYRESYKRAKSVRNSMDKAQKCIFTRQFQQAVELLTASIDEYQPLPLKAPLYASLYTKRAEAHLRLKKYSEALKDCAHVVYAQEDDIPAWLIRFQAHHGLGEHSAALEQVKDLLQKWPQDPRLQQAYERADFLVRKACRVDFYKLLGVPSIASEMEIKKAYKRKALELHPDKCTPGSSEEEQRKAQKRFQQLGEGLEILSDDFQRKLYDEGYDPAAIRERVEAANQAAHNPHHGRYPRGHYH